jgi:hypothetical protein
MATEAVTRVESIDELESAIAACRSRRSSCRLKLEGPLAQQPGAERHEKRLNRDLRACGCSEGTLGLISGLAAGLALCAAAGVTSTLLWVLCPTAMSIAGMGLGKYLGLRAAHRRLEKTLSELAQPAPRKRASTHRPG